MTEVPLTSNANFRYKCVIYDYGTSGTYTIDVPGYMYLYIHLDDVLLVAACNVVGTPCKLREYDL